MRNFFENKIAFATTFGMFALAFAWNVAQGAQPASGRLVLSIQPVVVAHGPMVPPDPWAGAVGHGPMVPPDPWAGVTKVAHGPMVPPDPWAGAVGHGPMVPPDPWAGFHATV